MQGNGVSAEDCRFLTIKKRKQLIIYHLTFDSLLEIERFLRSDPPVNAKSFQHMMSIRADEAFAGPPLDKAIAFCSGGFQEGIEDFFAVAKPLSAVTRQTFKQRKVHTAIVGSRPNVPAYIAGEPKNMYRMTRVVEKKVIRMYMNLSYNRNTTEEQIRRRGALVLNLIEILEQNGYIVDFRVFTASIEYSELFLCEIMLKKPGRRLEVAKVYYPMCGKAFLRRVISRLKESMPFNVNWGMTYGKVASELLIREILKIDSKSIYIGTPQEMGITGGDIRIDADAFLSRIHLDGNIIIPRFFEET
ncbi:MAG: hypothetical protein IJL03_04455 [Lachnospiraceae bacterium]|nr:hypothetical protein [Lachnospiraceae bacterium]